MSSIQDERRLFERNPARFPVKLKDTRQDYGASLFMRDVSAGGVKLTSKEQFFLNDNLSLEIKLPDGKEPLVLKGMVTWTRMVGPKTWDIGMCFHKIDFLKVSRIFRFPQTS